MVCKGFSECHTKNIKCKGCNECLVETNESNPTVSEKGISYTIKNRTMLKVLKYKVDGGLIDGVDEKRCDYLMMFPDCMKSFFIELKSQKWKEALEQLKNTFKILYPSMNGYIPHLRAVIGNGVPHTSYNEKRKLLKEMRRQHIEATLEIKKYSLFNDEV